MSERPPGAARQQGAVLLLLLMLVAISVSSVLVNALARSGNRLAADADNARVLAEARDALVGYAALPLSDANGRPKRFPCPADPSLPPSDTRYGRVRTSCTTAATRIGLVPWRDLGIPEPRDAAGELLWYAVSDNFRSTTAATPATVINSETVGQLTVTGTAAATQVIAVVMAPGAPVGGQVRAGNSLASNWLEGGNENLDNTFVSGLATQTFNDRLLAITGDDFLPLLERRVAGEFVNRLNEYFTDWGGYPYPTAVADLTRPNQQDFTGTAGLLGGVLPVSPDDEATWISATVTATGAGTLTGTSCDVDSDKITCKGKVTGTPRINIAGVARGAGLQFVDPTDPRTGAAGVDISFKKGSTLFPVGLVADRTASLNPAGEGLIVLGFQVNPPSGITPSDVEVEIEIKVPRQSTHAGWTDPNSFPHGWLTNEDWYRLSFLALSGGFAPGGGNACGGAGPPCVSIAGLSGGATFRGAVIMAGRPVAGQAFRPATNFTQYLEGANATPTDQTLASGPRSSTFNDYVLPIQF